MSNLEWFSTKRNSDGSFSILVPKDWPESIKHKALDAIELGIQAGAEKEQERIIKLLEDNRNDFSVNRGFGEIENLADDAIALIKGEN